MSGVRFSTQFHQPPGFNKVIEGIKKHGTCKQRGYVKYDDLRSIALASDRSGYANKSEVAALRAFLLTSGTIIEDGSQKYYFDSERAQVVLEHCDKKEILPAGINPQLRLRFLKYKVTRKTEDVLADVNGAQVTSEGYEETKTASSDDESFQMRWVIRLTSEQAKILLSVVAGHVTTRVSTLLGVGTTEPLKQIGLLIKHGERRLAVWKYNLAIAKQCRFDLFLRENHRGISTVHEVRDVQVIAHGQWQEDLKSVAMGTATGAMTITPEQAVVIVDPVVNTSTPEVFAKEQEVLPNIQMNLPVQYALIQESPQTMTDDQLEEAMLAILVFTASLKNRHAQFVEEKNQRTQTKINDARAEKDRLDAELRDLRSREQELEQAREAAETKLALLQQSIAS
jgi:hypothetical protein